MERDALRALADIGARHGVKLAVETLWVFDRGQYTATAARLAEEIRAIDHPFVCGTLDFSHVYLHSTFLGLDFRAQIEAFAPVAGHLHVHDLFGRPKLTAMHALGGARFRPWRSAPADRLGRHPVGRHTAPAGLSGREHIRDRAAATVRRRSTRGGGGSPPPDRARRQRPLSEGDAVMSKRAWYARGCDREAGRDEPTSGSTTRKPPLPAGFPMTPDLEARGALDGARQPHSRLCLDVDRLLRTSLAAVPGSAMADKPHSAKKGLLRGGSAAAVWRAAHRLSAL